MKNFLWLGVIALVLYFLVKRGGVSSTKAPVNVPDRTPGSGTPAPFWQGWDLTTAQGLQNTTKNVQDEYAAIGTSISSGVGVVTGLFSGLSKIFGSGGVTSPQGSGSGSGAPAQNDTSAVAGNQNQGSQDMGASTDVWTSNDWGTADFATTG